MPFIWDDIVWKLIDDEDSYDKSRFVVVRKLHIKLNTGLWQVVVGIFFIPFQSKKRKYLKKSFSSLAEFRVHNRSNPTASSKIWCNRIN